MKAFKYRIYPTKEQEILLAKHFGCARWIYNYGLSLKTEIYQKEGKCISVFEISNKITQLKKEEETKWLKEVNSQSLQSALRNLDTAFSNFFNKKSEYPKFKSKRKKQSFQCPQFCKVDFENSKLIIPKFRKGIKAVFHRKFEGKIKTCTISKTPTNKYFVSIVVDDEAFPKEIEEPNKEKCLGIDLGISHYLADSEGNKIGNPRHLNKKLKKLQRESRKHSRKVKGSNNREKQRKILARQHEKVADARKDFLHKLTHEIAENQSYNCVAMESLDIQGMMRNGKLARHIGDAAWHTFQTFLEYKLKERGKSLIKIGQFEPSSKLCSCGVKNGNLQLKDRIWTCKSCGVTHDRDMLAAKNIKKFAFLEQNTKFVGAGCAEFTPVEIGDTRSLKQEAPAL